MLKIVKILNSLKPELKLTESNIVDYDFTLFPYIKKFEKVINSKGEFEKQPYYFNEKEVIYIAYEKLFDNVCIDNTVYSNEFVGFSKTINYLNEDGSIGKKKEIHTTFFTLLPVFDDEGEFLRFNSRAKNLFLENVAVNKMT